MESRKIIIFEWNEVPYPVIDYYCELVPASCLSRTLACSSQYETYAGDTGILIPTKTWSTVHRGVNNDRHGIANFGQMLDEVDKEFPPLWKLAAFHGVKTGVFGSLFSSPMPNILDNYSFYMPDIFATDNSAHPLYLSSFQDFNLSMCRASAQNVSSKIDLKAAFSICPYLPNLGLTLKTFYKIGRQLFSEKLNPIVKTRRRNLQAVLGFDIFMKQLQIFKPDLATFFTNHVAATMHRYWAATFPDDYENFQLEDEWVASYCNEIDCAMQESDHMLAKLVNFVEQNPDYILLVVTSLGQAAFVAEHTATCLNIDNISKFMSCLGLEPSDYEQRPAMAPIINVIIAESKIKEFQEKVSKITINGDNLANITKELGNGFFEFNFERWQNYQGPEYVNLEGSFIPFTQIGIENKAYEENVFNTADHIPQGVMFSYDPKHKAGNSERTQISTLDIAPSILNNFAIPIPSYMNRPINL